MSKVSSANLRFAASISSSRTLRTPLRATRSRAFSSIELDRSMPVTEQSRGYSAALMPVPTPTSSTRSPGLMPIRWIASHAAGVQRRAEREVVDRRELLVDAGDEIVLDGGDRQRARRGVGPEDLFGFARTMRLE